MTLYFQAFVFFIMYVLFGVNYIFNPSSSIEQEYYNVIITLDYPEEVIYKVIWFNATCFLFLIFGFFIGNKYSRSYIPKNHIKIKPSTVSLLINIFLLTILAFLFYGVLENSFKYHKLVHFRHSVSYIFEMRIIPHILISYLLFIGGKFSLNQKILLFLYFLFLVAFQARSLIFEFLCCLSIPLLLKQGDKVKYRFIFVLALMPFIPNLFIIARYWPMTLSDIKNNFFSFEYSLLFNLNIAEIIYKYEDAWMLGSTFIDSIFLLVPSFLREFFGFGAIKNEIYKTIGDDSGVKGGGFSLPGELFLNFNWLSVLYFMIVGIYLAYGRKAIIKQLNFSSSVSFFHASYALIYSSLILALRNDFGVLLKYLFYLWVLSFILDLILRRGVVNK